MRPARTGGCPIGGVAEMEREACADVTVGAVMDI
jgi:hypothetical protein